MLAPARAAVLVVMLTAAACKSGTIPAKHAQAQPAPPRTTTASASSAAAPTSSSTTSPTRVRTATAVRTRSVHPKPPPRPHADQLPLAYPTGAARQVVTVEAAAESDTEGELRAWRRVAGGWRPIGPPLHAWLGQDGMTPHPSESLSAVPMGSFSLTQAFGRDADPGTALPYRQTTPADWWISEPGPYYNTEQHCAADCPFTQGSPNEHLYYETPFYNYAAVIDYNRDPVRQGAGSAFFLHVAAGEPTQGCVAIEQDQLLRILRWLRPAAHPRIVIGTS